MLMRQCSNGLLAMLLMMPVILILMFEFFMLMMNFISAMSFFDGHFHTSHSRIGEELQNVKLCPASAAFEKG